MKKTTTVVTALITTGSTLSVVNMSAAFSKIIFSCFVCELFFFLFFKLTANDRGYGLGRSAGEFPVAIATKEMRAQRLPEAH
jgi:hypothetical protein